MKNVYCLDSFRSSRNNFDLSESYCAFLQDLSVADLFYESKNTIDEIQKVAINVYHLNKADKILEEISRRVSDDSPKMSESLNSLRSEIQSKISQFRK